MEVLAWTVILVGVLLIRDTSAKCYGEGPAENLVCVPGPINFPTMQKKNISSTSTCGTPPSRFCRLSPLNSCFQCNASDPDNRHPVEYMADPSGQATWWQSQTWWDWRQNNPNTPLKVDITISFNKTYDITGVISLVFHSPRPEKAVLEKSTDKGLSWVPLQYYARNCLSQFNMADTNPNPFRFFDFSAYCTQFYSNYFPLEGGILQFDFLKRYTKESFFQANVQSYLCATDLRLRMEYPGTNGLEISSNQATLEKYFYGISDVEIVARCKCNGHAQWCDFPNLMGKNCDCLHNTAGDDCEKCLPLYNNRTWRAASSESQPNPCEKCDCNEHADSCTYNPSHGYGVCDNCKHNTTGHFCQLCKDKFYRNVSLSLTDPKICPACDCFPEGSFNNGTCHKTTGQCECHANVTGRQCDHCDDTYWGYTVHPIGHCSECNCFANGTVNSTLNCHQLTGQCPCKPNIHLNTCSECRHGFYSFPTTSDGDCLACDCDYGGSVLQICNKTIGNCICRKNINQVRCTEALPGYFTPSFDYAKYEAEFSPGSYQQSSNTVDLDKYFTGIGYGRLSFGQFINIRVTLDVSWKWYLLLRYTDLSPGSDQLQVHITADAVGNCSFVNTTVVNVTGLVAGQGVSWRSATPIEICPGQEYNFNISFAASALPNASIDIDSLVLLPEYKDSRVYRLNGFNVSTMSECWDNSMTLALSNQSDTICTNISFSVMAEVFDGALACQCSSIGTVQNSTCDPYGGQCRCKPGVTGRTCDRCKPGFYDFSSEGCKPCNCVSLGSHQLVCNPVTGQCPCKPGVITRTCSRCNDSYYGFTTGQGCVECKCNSSGSANLQCNDVTGNCTCKNSTDGHKCDRCRFGFYNFTADGCQACNCHEGGSKTLQCHLQSGNCTCKANALGFKCDTCRNGTYNSDSNNPDGCTPCYCYGRSNTCTSATGFVRSYLTTEFSSGINGWSSTAEGIGMGPQQKSNGLEFTFTQGQNLTLGFATTYLGDQLNSYGELVEFHIQHSATVGALSAKWTLIVESRDKIRFPVKPAPSPDVTSYYVRIQETYAESPTTARALQEVMADLKSANLRGEFQSSGSFVVSKVTMHTAVRNESGVNVGNVENCTCSATNYTGLSCELCNEGYTRTVPRFPRFGTCELCSCTGRSAECDGETGQCRNCRTGSQGFFCEQCQPGVDNTTDCTQCWPEYWGLKPGSGGCQDCDCLLPNTLYGNSSVCNATTGMCTCKPKISGRICDRCHENAYNTSRGCVECPECYSQLQAHVQKLRGEITSLTELIDRVKNGNIGDVTFAESLSSSVATIASIVSKAANSTGVEKKLYEELVALNNSLNNIEDTLKTEVTTGVTSLENVTTATQQDRQRLVQLIRQTTELVQYSYNVLNTSVKGIVTQVGVTDEYLKGFVPTFTSQAAMATAQAAQQNRTGEEILNMTSSAERFVTSAGVTSVEAVSRHNVTSQLTLALKTQAESVRMLGTGINSTAHALYANVTAVLDAASRALQSAQALDPNNTANVTEVKQGAAAALINASAVIARINAMTKQYASLVSDTRAAVRNTETIMATVQRQEAQGKKLLVEARRALAEADAAVESASKTHEDALEMRQTLETFAKKANESQQLAALALAQSIEANKTSLEAIAYTESINKTIQATLAVATQGLELAQEARRLATTDNQAVTVVHNLAKDLKTSADTSPYTADFMDSKQTNTTSISNSISPAIEACKQNYSSMATDAKTVAEESLGIAQQASSNINTAKQSVDRVLSEIPKLKSVNTTRLLELQQEIKRLRAEFTTLDVKTINTQLRVAQVEQQAFINEYKTKVQELRRQVDELKTLQSSLGVPPRGCS